MTTVITLPGIFGWKTLPNTWFNGALTTIGSPVPECFGCDFAPITDVINLQYNQAVPSTAARKIARTLTDLPSGEQAIVTGHSEGALGIVLFAKHYAPTFGFDPSRLLLQTSGAGPQIKTPEPPITQCRYRIVDVTKGFDEIADKPNVPWSLFFQKARDNARKLKVHTWGYQGLDLSGPHRKCVNGQMTYLFYPTTKVAVPDVTLEQIDTAYSRDYLSISP